MLSQRMGINIEAAVGIIVGGRAEY